MAEMVGSTRHESVPVGVPRELARPGKMLLAAMEMALGVEMRLGAVEAVDGAAMPTAANVDAVAAAMMSDLSMSNFPAVETMAAMLTPVAAAMAATSALRQSNRRARKRSCGQAQDGCGEGAELGHAALLIDHLCGNFIQLATAIARSDRCPGCGAARSAASGAPLTRDPGPFAAHAARCVLLRHLRPDILESVPRMSINYMTRSGPFGLALHGQLTSRRWGCLAGTQTSLVQPSEDE
jgi:hypothetical protein